MKKISPLRLGFAFAGSFLGAGYVSGQEIWQFFGRFGAGALPGLALAMVLMGAIGLMVWELAKGLDMTEMDLLCVEREIPVLRWILSAVQAVMLFGFTVIMCAGGVALCVQQWNLPEVPCAVVLSIAVAAVSLAGIPGLVNLFSGLVPVLCVVTVAAAAVAAPLMAGGLPAASAASAESAFGGWPLSAAVFFAYNTFGAIGIFAPMGPMAADRRSIRRGILVGCAILMAIALSVLVAMAAIPGSESTEMPMLSVVTACFPWLAPAYAVVLLVTMFGAALGCLVALMTFLQEKSAAVRSHRVLWTAGIMAAALLGSFVGFSDLIGVLYPIFGYCGIGFLALLAMHWLHKRKELEIKN